MTNNSSHSSRRWLKLFLKTGSAIGLGLFLLAIVVIGFGQWWVKNNLAPIVSQELSKSLQRPVSLGNIDHVWLNEIHISNAKIPPNGSDVNAIEAPNIVVNFNPIKLLFDRTLKLDIRAISPRVYLSQNSQGNWINIPVQDKKFPPPIKIEVGTIKINDARVDIVPYSQIPQPISVSKIDIQANINDNQERVNFNSRARFWESGQVQIQGNSLITNGETQLGVKGQKLDAVAVTRIVKIPEVKIANGTVDGDLNLAFRPQKYLRINSNLLINNGKVIINNVPRSLDEINGFIRVSERDIKFDNITTKYDRVPGVISGDLNYRTGYRLSAKTGSVSLPDIFKSIGVKSPFPLTGAAVAQLQLTGKLARPMLVGKFNNSQISQVDRVQIDRVNGNFKLADGQITLAATAQPKLGGKITSQGSIQLLKTPQISFQVQGDRLPGDVLSRLYGAKLPPRLKIGDTSVRGTIEGTGADIYTNLKVNAPQAAYPLSTDLQITPQGKMIVRGATLLAAGGKVQATGEVTKTNWQLNLQPQALDIQKLAKISGLNLPDNYSGKLIGNIRATGLNNNLDIDHIQARGQLNLQLPAGQILVDQINVDRGNWQANISSNALNLRQLTSSKLDPNNLSQTAQNASRFPDGIVSGKFDLNGNSLKKISYDVVQAQGSGKLKLKTGSVQLQSLAVANGNWQGIFTADDLNLAEINSKVSGKFSGEAQLTGNLSSFAPESLRGLGKGKIDLPKGKIVGNNLQIDRGKWQGDFQSSSIVLGSLAPEIPLKFKNAKLDGNIRASGNLNQLKLEDIRVTGSGRLSLADASILARQLEIKSGEWRGNFAVDRLKLGDISDNLPAEFKSAQLTGNFVTSGELSKFNLDRLQVAGDAKLNLAEGQIRATGFKLERGKFFSNLAIANLKLGSINNQLSSQLRSSRFAGNFKISGNVNKLTATTIQASGNGKLTLANGGEISASNFQTGAGIWQSDLALRGLNLGTLNPDLPAAIKVGLLFGDFRIGGNLKYPDLAQLQVRGNGQISNLLGGNIRVDNLALNNGQWQSKVIADRLNIGDLAKFAPKNFANTIGANLPQNRLAGQLNANWLIGGNLQDNSFAAFQLSGPTKLTNFQIGALKFDPNLIGKIQVNPGQGVDIAFVGKNDRLALTLDKNLQPQSFDFNQQDLSAKGSVDRQILNIDIKRLPIALFQPWIPKSVGIQSYRLDGNAQGNLAINLANFQVSGDRIEITNPIFGAFEGERLLTNFRYGNGQFNLSNTEIQRGANTYRIDAILNPGATSPTFQAKLQVPKGNIEDLRNLLQIFGTNDVFQPLNQRQYGTAADLGNPTQKLAILPQSLNNQLRSLSELRRWLNRETDRQQESSIIPDVGNLQGDFSGEIAIASNPKSGFSSDFNITGANWQLERYRLDRLQATGNWRNGKLHLEPLNLTIDNSQITIAGDFGVNNQNAQVNIQNFSAKSLASLIDQPVDINGGVNLSAQISGNLANPRASGQISLENAQLNNTKLQQVAGNFNYWDGRLNFSSDATFANQPIISSADRIKITGSIPYQLPFTLTAPASNDIKIDLSLQNQGLQVIDVFSRQQLRWIDGQGKIALSIDGKMKPFGGGIETLTASGTASISKARIQSAAIPEPLTDVNGEIVFDFDRVEVQKLTGKFNRGQLQIAGILPISDNFSIEPSKQLNIQIQGIAVNLKEKYNGDINGNLTILGTAFTPILTGNIQLSNGQVFLPEAQNTTTTILGIQPAIPEAPNPDGIQLRQLQINLGENLQITRAPILNFLATGKLDLDGTIDNPRPFGQIQLQKGSVNIFTTQFRLASGPQTADFFPTLGTDPVLNLQLYAKTLESTSSALAQRNSVARTVTNGEIDRPAEFYTTSLGSVQTVQVEARVAGLASQLTQKLELTSSPSRSQAEIVLLLGGALAERLTSGGDIGLGVVSLASSNLLNTLQDRIGDVLSLSDFRLFPTITRDSQTSSNSTFGIAAEIGTQITPKFSASVFKILTNSESPYYSLRYRVSDQILIRGSTNLFGENRAILEFEQRF